MSFVSGTTGSEAAQNFLEVLQNDFRNLSLETKKKYPQIRESCDEAIAKLRSAAANPQTPVFYVVNQIMYPLVQGCESKDVKIIKFCLGMMQRLITQQVVDPKGARFITNTLWNLMQSGTEEVRLLQSVTLLLTTNTVVHGETLARTLVLCFRLHFTKDSTTINTAGATVRQLVSLVFERVLAEEAANPQNDSSPREVNLEELKTPSSNPPKGLKPCAADAFLMFQDLVQLVNADQPFWLIGMTEMTRTFGLELLESVLTNFSEVFFKNQEFSFLLKERVCALVIKLFSPNLKYRSSVPAQSAPMDKPYFPISVRLLRVVAVLIQKYHSLLVTECEIFLSLIVKFLEPDKPPWQRTLALQVLHKLCVSSQLVHSLCQSYDLQPHATNIFQDIVNSLGAYVQSMFVGNMGQSANSSSAPVVQPGMLNMNCMSQPGFFFRGIWLPIIGAVTRGQARATYLEMLDKIDPPVIPEGYGISIAYACLLDIVQSLANIMTKNVDNEPTEISESDNKSMTVFRDKIGDDKINLSLNNEEDVKLYNQLINSSWCGLLAAFVPLIESSTDEQTTENILKAIQVYTGLCGHLELNTPRDAFITAICKASLPSNYILNVFNLSFQGVGNTLRTHSRTSSQDLNQYSVPYECDYRQQVVVVGTPLPTASLPAGAQQGPVMLTAKNLQCMRSLLTLSHSYGIILGTAWHIVLSTLQHLVWILGLKPSTGGSLKAVRTSNDSNAVITTAVMADLPILSAMLSRLFESSQTLNDVALHHLIDALCQLSLEAMELAYSNREPSLFAVAKLLETGLVNLPRVEVLWRPLTNHLLEVCRHPHIRMREWGVEAITYLVKAALQHKYSTPLKENQRLQILLLGPLAELNSVHHVDVREGQLDCVLQILHGCGETLSFGWPLVLGIIGAVSEHHGENLIRVAFQCLQLVVTDFLPIMPCNCLTLCVDTAAKFGSQTQELNISLTAVGLMWNISDYFYQNQEKLCAALNSESSVLPEFPGTPNMPHFDKLWMCLYTWLGDLCVDPRPAVRKSAGQTLFSTISAHGILLNQNTWQSVLWLVLFPLLDKVRTLSMKASSEKVDTSGNILIHHTRNTAQKQWAETQVLTLSGVARVFNTKRQLLLQLGDFPKAWSLLLEFIEYSALSKNNEVSLAALKSFQEILYSNKTDNKSTDSETSSTTNNNTADLHLWNVAWKIWLNIGIESTNLNETVNKEDSYIPSQGLLTALVQIFPAVFQHIRNSFTADDLNKLCQVLRNAMTVPISNDNATYMVPPLTDMAITPLQDGVLHCMQLLQKEALSTPAKLNSMISSIFKQLLNFTTLACSPPTLENSEHKHISGARGPVSNEWVTTVFVPFGEKSMNLAVKLYQTTAAETAVIQNNILYEMIKAIHLPLSLKYNCISHTTWKLAISSLLIVLKTGLPVARSNSQYFADMWLELYETLDHFLFPKSVMGADHGLDDLVTDETIDCQVIELLRCEVLPYSHCMPKQFILKVVVLLNKGSIHSATGSNMDSESELKLREEFAKTCFETLLQFSLLDSDDIDNNFINSNDQSNETRKEGGVAGRLAVTALLYRFQEVLKKYNEDERQSGKCPLPRYRMSEISFVLKAVATLIVSMKKAPAGKVDVSAWNQLIGLYPYLVECTVTASTQVSRSLRECLMQYSDLLQPPSQMKSCVT